MQQFLIPSSGGTSQIINIPVSLLSQGNQQPISFITANGQIFQLPNFCKQKKFYLININHLLFLRFSSIGSSSKWRKRY